MKALLFDNTGVLISQLRPLLSQMGFHCVIRMRPTDTSSVPSSDHDLCIINGVDSVDDGIKNWKGPKLFLSDYWWKRSESPFSYDHSISKPFSLSQLERAIGDTYRAYHKDRKKVLVLDGKLLPLEKSALEGSLQIERHANFSDIQTRLTDSNQDICGVILDLSGPWTKADEEWLLRFKRTVDFHIPFLLVGSPNQIGNRLRDACERFILQIHTTHELRASVRHLSKLCRYRLELRALLRKGRQALAKKHFRLAAWNARKGLRLQPGNPAFLALRGEIYLRRSRLRKAQICFEKSLQWNPFYTCSVLRLSELRQRSLQIEEMLRLNPRAVRT